MPHSRPLCVRLQCHCTFQHSRQFTACPGYRAPNWDIDSWAEYHYSQWDIDSGQSTTTPTVTPSNEYGGVSAQLLIPTAPPSNGGTPP